MENKKTPKQALERLDRDCEYYENGIDEERHEEDVEIIDQALTDYECLNNFFNKLKTNYGIDDLDYLEHIVAKNKGIEKKLKALEIVKEKIMPLVQLYDNRVYDNEDYEYRELTPEDYKLLKEVLL